MFRKGILNTVISSVILRDYIYHITIHCHKAGEVRMNKGNLEIQSMDLNVN